MQQQLPEVRRHGWLQIDELGEREKKKTEEVKNGKRDSPTTIHIATIGDQTWEDGGGARVGERKLARC